MNLQELDRFLRTLTDDELSKNVAPRNPQLLQLLNMLSKNQPRKESLEALLQTVPRAHPNEQIFMLAADFYYFDGIVVSKQNRFQDIEPHQHEWLELVYMYSGNCTLEITGEQVVLRQGHCVLINRDTPHSLQACGIDDILLNFLIRSDYINLNFLHHFSSDSYLSKFLIDSLNFQQQQQQQSYIYFQSEDSRRLSVFIMEFLCEYFDREMNSKDILDNCFALIFLELANIYTNSAQSGPKSHAQRILPILRYIEMNYTTCTLEELAKQFHMSPVYLSRYIKKHAGKTYKELVQEYRLQFAAHLLACTGLPVTEIVCQAGYSNVKFFYTIFKRKYGRSPSEYRKEFHSSIAGVSTSSADSEKSAV